MLVWLALAFLLTAALYAAVGFGGGSTYIALLALAGTDYRLLPVVALTCNIIVVAGGTWRFQAAGVIPWRKIWPILLLSVPAAWLGGRIPIAENLFLWLLGLSLLAAGLLLLLPAESKVTQSDGAGSHRPWFAPLSGAGIGFLSGLVGIGGGIFLAPLLLLTGWASPRVVAATASVYILVNSLAGVTGQLMKSGTGPNMAALGDYWPLFAAVLIGGQVGSLMASKKLPQGRIRQLTALLILFVAIRLLWQQLHLIA